MGAAAEAVVKALCWADRELYLLRSMEWADSDVVVARFLKFNFGADDANDICRLDECIDISLGDHLTLEAMVEYPDGFHIVSAVLVAPERFFKDFGTERRNVFPPRHGEPVRPPAEPNSSLDGDKVARGQTLTFGLCGGRQNNWLAFLVSQPSGLHNGIPLMSTLKPFDMPADLTAIPDDIQFEIICKSDGLFLCSEAVQDRVIGENPAFLDRIENPHTTKKFLTAIRNNPSFLTEFHEPPLPWQEAVVAVNIRNIWYINTPAPVFKTAFLEHLAGVPRSNAEDTTDDIKRRAVENDWRAIRFIDEHDDNMQWIALQQSWEAIKYIDEPSVSQQLLACRSAEAVSYLNDYFILSDDEEVIALAKKSLLDALTRGPVSEMDSNYRRLFLDMATGEEILESLSSSGKEPAFEPSDFNFIPSDLIKIKVAQRLGLRKYLAQAPAAWSTSPGFRGLLAGYKDGGVYGYSYLGKTDDYEKAEFIKLLAGGSVSNNPLDDEATCERAIRQSDISIIHTAFACVPSPSDEICWAYLAMLAVERGRSSINPLSLNAADDLIRSCPDSRNSLQVAKAASRFNDRLREICGMSQLLSDDDDTSAGRRVDLILNGIAAATDQDPTNATLLGKIGLDDIETEIS